MSDPGNDRLLRDASLRAATDQVFRKRLLTQPEQAIYDAFGVRLPSSHRLRFIEKPADVDTLIVLPDLENGQVELDDDQLDAAAGGEDDPPPPPPPSPW